MKVCTLCKVEKTLDCFNKNSSKKSGLSNVCRDCNKTRSKLYYSSNLVEHRKKVRARNIKIIKKNRDFTDSIKSCGCIVCNESEIVCLDFHHLDPMFKEDNISLLSNCGYSIERLEKEIEKCVVICSNCHRKLHAGKIDLLEFMDVKL